MHPLCRLTHCSQPYPPPPQGDAAKQTVKLAFEKIRVGAGQGFGA